LRRALAGRNPLAPQDAARLYWYPGVASFELRDLISPSLSPKADVQAIFGKPDAPVKIDLRTEEISILGLQSLGLEDEVRLLADLGIAGEWGIFAQSDLGARTGRTEKDLAKLIRELKKEYGIAVEFSGGCYFLTHKSLDQLQVIAGTPSCPFFVQNQRIFTGEDLTEFYGVEDPELSRLISRWELMGWVQKFGAEGRYLSTFESTSKAGAGSVKSSGTASGTLKIAKKSAR